MGYIGLEELSNTLKDYLKGLGLTENQVNETIKQITGDKTQLQTSNKTNLVSAINEVFQSGVNAKQGLVEALTSKNVEASTSESWESLNNKVRGIPKVKGIEKVPTWNRSNFEIKNIYVPCTNIPVKIMEHSADIINDRMYNIGGSVKGTNITSKVKTNHCYDILTNTWSKLTDCPKVKCMHVSGVVNGEIFTIGGFDSQDNNLVTNDVYNPETNAWTTKAKAICTVDNGTVIDNNIFVLGSPSGASTEFMYIYDTILNTWSTKKEMPVSNGSNPIFEHYNGSIYVFSTNSRLDPTEIYVYNIQNNSWKLYQTIETDYNILDFDSSNFSSIVIDKDIFFFCDCGNYIYDIVSKELTAFSRYNDIYRCNVGCALHENGTIYLTAGYDIHEQIRLNECFCYIP